MNWAMGLGVPLKLTFSWTAELLPTFQERCCATNEVI